MNFSFVLLAVSLLIFIVLSVFLYINREDAKIHEIYIKVFLALIAALLLIGYQLYTPEPTILKQVNILALPENGSYVLLEALRKANSKHSYGYSELSFVQTVSNDIRAENKIESNIIDDIENTFWWWMRHKYFIHWDIEEERFNGLSINSFSTWKYEGAEEECFKLEYSELIKLAYSNSVTKHYNGLINTVYFPKGTSIVFTINENHKREYVLSNSFYELKISMKYVGGTQLFGTKVGEYIKDKINDPDLYNADLVIVNFEAKFKSYLKGSPKLIRQKKWIIGLMEKFENDFSWDLIEPELYNEINAKYFFYFFNE